MTAQLIKLLGADVEDVRQRAWGALTVIDVDARVTAQRMLVRSGLHDPHTARKLNFFLEPRSNGPN